MQMYYNNANAYSTYIPVFALSNTPPPPKHPHYSKDLQNSQNSQKPHTLITLRQSTVSYPQKPQHL